MTSTAIIEELLKLGEIKVWSILVTLFGDRAPEAGDNIAGPDITSVVEPLGTKPEALRVALHRLRKDGWVDSTKSGRISLYHMTERARQEAHSVRDLIYQSELPLPKKLWLAYDTEALSSLDGLPLGREALLTDTPPAPLLLSGEVNTQSLPEWLSSAVIPDEAQLRFSSLLNVLDGDPPEKDTDLQATLRLMVLHAWRRLVLRHAPLALALQPSDAPSSQCRAKVVEWLAKIPANPDETPS